AGVEFAPPRLVLDRTREWTRASIGKLAQGLAGLARARGVDVVAGHARFADAQTVHVTPSDGGHPPATPPLQPAIAATGPRPAALPGLGGSSSRIWDSAAALALPSVPSRLLVVGGGYIGLELGTVYAALGSEVTVVELTDGLLPGVDRDLVAPLARRLTGVFKQIHLRTRVTAVREAAGGAVVELAGEGAPSRLEVEQVLVAVGR